jgi:N-acetylmuramoyl-L-alanine amidase
MLRPRTRHTAHYENHAGDLRRALAWGYPEVGRAAKRPPWLQRRAVALALLLAAGLLSMVLHQRYSPRPVLGPPGADNPTVVCIDPGHPSPYSAGQVIHNGTTELDMNWAVAQKLAKLMSADPRMSVLMTRTAKYLIMDNRQRAEIANLAKARLIVHLHCDAGPSRGYTIYYPNCQGESEGKTGPSWGVIEASRVAAREMHDGMSPILRGWIKDRGLRTERFTKVGKADGALTSSVYSEVPTVTVEMVFLNNRWDARFIRSEVGQDLMAKALTAGINRFVGGEQSAERRR